MLTKILPPLMGKKFMKNGTTKGFNVFSTSTFRQEHFIDLFKKKFLVHVVQIKIAIYANIQWN